MLASGTAAELIGAAPPWRFSLRRRLTGPAVDMAALAVAVTTLALRDPHLSGSYGYCPFRALTGLPCPVCGGLRAINDLTRGDLHAALGSNAFVVLTVPVALAVWGQWVILRWRGRGDEVPPLFSAGFAAAAALALIAFGALRWTPWGASLAP